LQKALSSVNVDLVQLDPILRKELLRVLCWLHHSKPVTHEVMTSSSHLCVEDTAVCNLRMRRASSIWSCIHNSNQVREQKYIQEHGVCMSMTSYE
jgi:hypothetical protein